MQRINGLFTPSSKVKNWNRCKFETSEYNCFWEIDHFSKTYHSSPLRSLISPSFTNETNDIAWSLEITDHCPLTDEELLALKDQEALEESLGIYVHTPYPREFRIKLRLQLEWTAELRKKFGKFIVVDFNISKVSRDSKSMKVIHTVDCRQVDQGQREHEMDSFKFDPFESTDCPGLKIFCEAKVYYDMKNVVNRASVSVPSLSNDLSLLLTDSKHSDLTIQCEENEFRAHKAILSARSPVFTAMFDHNMRENQQNHIMLDDIGGRTLEAMLKFIYTDTTEDIDELAEELLIVADKYQLSKLKVICEETMMDTLTVDNVARVGELADRLGCTELGKCAKRFSSKQASLDNSQ